MFNWLRKLLGQPEKVRKPTIYGHNPRPDFKAPPAPPPPPPVSDRRRLRAGLFDTHLTPRPVGPPNERFNSQDVLRRPEADLDRASAWPPLDTAPTILGVDISKHSSCEDIRIGDTPIERYAKVQVQKRQP